LATGTIKRHCTQPTVKLTVTQGGSAYDLTDHTAKFIMWKSYSLSSAVANTTDTYIVLPASSYTVVETNDVVLINHERMKITAKPASEPTTTAHYTVTRGYTIPATKGTVYASTTVAGGGANIFTLSGLAQFVLNIDGAGGQTVDVTSTSTSGNYLISHLVTDVQNAVDSVCTVSTATVGNVANRLYIESDTTGTSSSVIISDCNSTCTAQLGFVADTDYGESAVTCDKGTHDAGDTVYVIKIERDARINDATNGVLEYEWRSGDTDKLGTFNCSFEVKTDEGRYFEIPTDDSFTVEIVADPNDRLVAEGE